MGNFVPTERDFETAREVLGFLLTFTELHESHAINCKDTLRFVLDNLPDSVEQLEDSIL